MKRNNISDIARFVFMSFLCISLCVCVGLLSACGTSEPIAETDSNVADVSVDSETVVEEESTDVIQPDTEENIEETEPVIQSQDKEKIIKSEAKTEERVKKAEEDFQNTQKKKQEKKVLTQAPVFSTEEMLEEKEYRNQNRAMMSAETKQEADNKEQEVTAVVKTGENYEIVNSYTALQVGAESEEVAAVQTKLISLGYLNDVADGMYGPMTQAAVQQFQQDNNINENGIGEMTIQKLGLNADTILDDTQVLQVEYTDSATLGTAGRLYIPSVDIAVALYWCTYDASAMMDTQVITNAWDSAYAFYEPKFVVGDHNNQEFSNLFNVQVGAEGYYVNSNGEMFPLICVGTGVGYTDGWKIYDQNGTSWDDWDYYLVTCTSVNNPEDLFVAEWALNMV